MLMATTTSRKTITPWVMIFPVLMMLALLVIAPILTMLVYSFFTNIAPAQDAMTLTAENWREVVTDSYFVGGLWKTVRISAIVAVLSALLGYPVAYFIATNQFKQKWILIVALMAPFWVSYIIRTFSWIAILGENGAINYILMAAGLITTPLEMLYTEGAVIIGILHFVLPYMILNVYVVLDGLDTSLVPAARSLGCNSWQAFREVTLPLSAPGLSVGLFLSFVLSAGSYVTPAILGSARDFMYGNLIYDAIMVELNWPLGAALSMLLLALFAVTSLGFVRFIGAGSLQKGFAR